MISLLNSINSSYDFLICPENNIPASLVRAVYAHYKVEFTPKQLGQEEVKPAEETPLTVQETIEKAFNESQSNNK